MIQSEAFNISKIKSQLGQLQSQITSDKVQKCQEFLGKYNYNITSTVLGAGSFGLVLKGIDTNSQKEVGIKILIAQDQDARKKCIEEAQKIKLIKSDFVIKIFDYFEDSESECFYIISEYCEKGDLQKYYLNIRSNENEKEKISLSFITIIMQNIMQGLIDIHNKELIHCDIKPSNILLTKDLKAKICDFGLSRFLKNNQTHVSVNQGTFCYQPLEQISKKLCFESDYYAVGGILCYLCDIPIEKEPLVSFKLKYEVFPDLNHNKQEYKPLIDIAKNLMKNNPKQRWTPQKAIQELKNKQYLLQQKNNFQLEQREYDFVEKKNGKIHGEGTQYYKNGDVKYKGKWEEGKKYGEGVYFNEDGDKLIGNYKNDMKNGDFVEYYPNQQIKFKGSYKNDQKQGQVLEYYPNGGKKLEAIYDDDKKEVICKEYYQHKKNLIKFDGIYKENERYGKGKEYYENGNLKYEGNYQHDLMHGQGIFYDETGLQIYNGNWDKGLYHGKGVLREKIGDKVNEYKGIFNNNLKFGEFEDRTYILQKNSNLTNEFLVYQGQYLNDIKYGKGILNFQLNDEKQRKKFEGQFIDGWFKQGKLTFVDKEYSGEFYNNKMHGYGYLKCTNTDKKLYEGYLENDLYEGKGYFYNKDGTYIEGVFKQNMCEKGQLKDKNNNILFEINNNYYKELENGQIYVGDIQNGQLHGKGTIFYKKFDKIIYQGQFENGAFNGQGVLLYQGQCVKKYHIQTNQILPKKIEYKKGQKIYKGEFKNNNFFGKGIIFENDQIHFEGDLNDNQGTLYNSGQLLYQGSFQNCKYQGKGKLYDNVNILYDGEFHSGQYQGKGKLYQNANILYDGEFQSGQYQGQGILYENNGEIKYEGQFKKNMYEGNGKLNDNIFSDVGIFENNNLFEGFSYKNGQIYKQIQNGQDLKYKFIEEIYFYHGDNSFEYTKYLYSHLLSNNLPEKNISKLEIYIQGKKYVLDNLKNCHKIDKENQDIYIGELEDAQSINCKGLKVDRKTNRILYIGNFQKNQFHGKGYLFNCDGSNQEGIFQHQFLLRGITLKNDNTTQADFQINRYSQQCHVYDSTIYIGQIQNGLKIGEGKLYQRKDYSILYEGYFVNDQMESQNSIQSSFYAYEPSFDIILKGNFKQNNFESGEIHQNFKQSFNNDQRQYFIYTWQQVLKVDQDFKFNFKQSLQGKVLNNKSQIIYKGQIIDNLYMGQGILYCYNAYQHYCYIEGTFNNHQIQDANIFQKTNDRYVNVFQKKKYFKEGKLIQNIESKNIFLIENCMLLIKGENEEQNQIINPMSSAKLYQGSFNTESLQFEGNGTVYFNDYNYITCNWFNNQKDFLNGEFCSTRNQLFKEIKIKMKKGKLLSKGGSLYYLGETKEGQINGSLKQCGKGILFQQNSNRCFVIEYVGSFKQDQFDGFGYDFKNKRFGIFKKGTLIKYYDTNKDNCSCSIW